MFLLVGDHIVARNCSLYEMDDECLHGLQSVRRSVQNLEVENTKKDCIGTVTLTES